ncbi:MAG: transketolase C-terminal domain-containing protein [Bacteroidales bacterium]|jgi:transketolase|nr:transketolase C-terminal domain-containing protein [Bacteroidales bacterium]
MFTLKQHKPTRFGFGEGLKSLGEKYPNVVALGADITSSVSVNFFREAFPDRFFSFGIAEQNIIGAAAGLALGGKIPFATTYGVFSALRTTDQIRVSVCYNNLPVKIGGAHAGISVGPDGATHQALEDIAIMRALPNMTVLSPCDATQTRLATIASVEQVQGPAYIRFGREAVPDFTTDDFPFEVGKGQLLKEGKDITLVATGHLVWEALQAALTLEKQKISARVINIHTIKPLDEEIIIRAARDTGCILTAEEHQVYGGLGSAVAEVLVKSCPVKVTMVGINDQFGESGKPEELMQKYGLTSTHIADQALQMIKHKQLKK